MFGKLIKEKRLQKNLGLRSFCKKIDEDASNWSKVERELIPPPQNTQKLEKIAKALGIKRNTDEWNSIIDQASVDSGIIPRDLLSDRDVLNALPAFFRTIRSEKPSEKELELVIQKIRRGA